MSAGPPVTGVARLTAPVETGVSAAPLVIAHRGNSSVAPENTLVAFESAWRAGADLIEVDLQLTRRGTTVIVHDTTVDATTDGSGPVEEIDGARLADLDAGSWFAEVYRGQRVPTSDDVLAFLTTHPGLGLLAELKGVWSASDARRFADAVTDHGLGDRVVVQSFWTETVAALAAAVPELPRALLISSEPAGLLQLCQDLEVMACNPCGDLVSCRPGLVAELHGAGLQVMPWTLNEPAHWRTAVQAGVDGIITDRPDRLRGWLSHR